MTSLHRPVCPTSQEPESLPGRRTYCRLRMVFVSAREETVASPKRFSPGSATSCSGCRGPLSLSKQGIEGRHAEAMHTERVPSHVLLGAGTQEAPTPPCLRILGFGGSAQGLRGEAMQPLLPCPALHPPVATVQLQWQGDMKQCEEGGEHRRRRPPRQGDI